VKKLNMKRSSLTADNYFFPFVTFKKLRNGVSFKQLQLGLLAEFFVIK